LGLTRRNHEGASEQFDYDTEIEGLKRWTVTRFNSLVEADYTLCPIFPLCATCRCTEDRNTAMYRAVMDHPSVQDPIALRNGDMTKVVLEANPDYGKNSPDA
jgi:hypothetical protein